MVKKSLKGGENKICPIECTSPAGNKQSYTNRVDCPYWIRGATMDKNCDNAMTCDITKERAERCITDKGVILHGDKSKCKDEIDQYWGYACVDKRYTNNIHNVGRMGGKNKKKQTKKSKKHMKKTKKNRRK